MMVIGLTGGIASGKTTVSSLLRELGADIIDADKIAREIVEPGQNTLKEIISEFGLDILNDDGALNRKALGNIVFNNSGRLKILNEITHPQIKKVVNERLGFIIRNNKDSLIIIDAAVLLECGMDKLVDEVWLVYVDYDTQLKRLMLRDNLNEHEAKVRIESQMSVEEKMKHSNKIIDNTKDLDFTKEQVVKLWHEAKNNGGETC